MSTATIHLFGDIGDWWAGSDKETFLQKIRSIDAERLNVVISSYGGYVSDGYAIYDLLKSYPGHVATYATGIVGSAAALVFAAGDERNMSERSTLFIHRSQGCDCGDCNTFKQAANRHEAIDAGVISAYVKQFGKPVSDVTALLDAGTWYTPDEALSANLATAVVDTLPAELLKGREKDVQMSASDITVPDRIAKVLNPQKNIFAMSITDKFNAFFNKNFTPKDGVKIEAVVSEFQKLLDEHDSGADGATPEQLADLETRMNARFDGLKAERDNAAQTVAALNTKLTASESEITALKTQVAALSNQTPMLPGNDPAPGGSDDRAALKKQLAAQGIIIS